MFTCQNLQLNRSLRRLSWKLVHIPIPYLQNAGFSWLRFRQGKKVCISSVHSHQVEFLAVCNTANQERSQKAPPHHLWSAPWVYLVRNISAARWSYRFECLSSHWKSRTWETNGYLSFWGQTRDLTIQRSRSVSVRCKDDWLLCNAWRTSHPDSFVTTTSSLLTSFSWLPPIRASRCQSHLWS